VALFEPIVTALNEAKVRYVVVGGVAVVLHGHAGLTADLDLAVDLTPGAAANAVDTLVGQGLRPRAPVEPSEFAQPEARAVDGGARDAGLLHVGPGRSHAVGGPIRGQPDRLRGALASIRDRAARQHHRTRRLDPRSHPAQADRRRPEDLLDIEALEAIIGRAEGDG
jgi:hypothetical protein